ncbi:MAG: FMN-binding protein [Saccharofermentanales bacterium]
MLKKKKILFVFLAVVFVIIVVGFFTKIFLENNLKKLSALEISDLDVSSLKDGTYTGKYSAFPVSAEVKVYISNHKIDKIDLISHVNGQGSSAEAIPGQIVQKQKVNVDIVSGATYSSKVIMKAVENALTGG